MAYENKAPSCDALTWKALNGIALYQIFWFHINLFAHFNLLTNVTLPSYEVFLHLEIAHFHLPHRPLYGFNSLETSSKLSTLF